MAYEGGTLKSTSINGVKMYYLSGHHRSAATWLNPKKQRALRKDQDYMQRVELVQDLRFETATTKIKATPDGEYLIASGIYPPQVKVYELREHSLKFERHLDSEIVDFQVLSDDYSKLAFLCADRSVALHAKYGKHYTMRIPRMGRNMTYDSWSCDLLCAASSPDLYRINLAQGRFLSSLSTQSPALNVVSRSKLHGLVACGGEDGAVECFDMRTRSSVGRINAACEDDQGVTAIAFDEDAGFQMAVGSSEGKVLIYDLRSSNPIRVKDHMYGSKILDIKWHRTLNSERSKLITTDDHIVRIWDPETGEGMTSIEPTGGAINDICVFRESGLILLALDSTMIPSYFLPSLGPAPKWCSYLENMTEEMEEGAQTTIYDDYKFVTKEELEKLQLTSLIGTKLLRAYMHGFFIDHRLYKKAKAVVDPFVHEDYIEKLKKDKMDKELQNRIALKMPKLPKRNRELFKKIHEMQEDAENDEPTDTKKSSKRKKGQMGDLLKDDRFGDLFTKEGFEIDENSEYYKALHPVTSTKKSFSLVNEHFEPVRDDGSASDSDASAPSDDEGPPNKKSKAPRLYIAKDERHAQAFLENKSLANEEALSMGERVTKAGDKQNSSRFHPGVKVGRGGSREISFVSRNKAKYKEDDIDEQPRGNKKRGVQSLGLKPTSYDIRSRGGGRGGGQGRGNRGRGRGGRGRGRGGRG